METNEIKKVLYKEKPMAIRTEYELGGDHVIYTTRLSDRSIIEFQIPMDEAANFNSQEPAQLLIRWIKN